MRDIIKEMGDEMPNRFFWLQVFLATNLAVTTLNFSITIETVFFFSFLKMGQNFKFV